TTTDYAHGTCACLGTALPPCSSGACRGASDDVCCGAGICQVTAYQDCCGAVCTALTTDSNCGACSHACIAGAHCFASPRSTPFCDCFVVGGVHAPPCGPAPGVCSTMRHFCQTTSDYAHGTCACLGTGLPPCSSGACRGASDDVCCGAGICQVTAY